MDALERPKPIFKSDESLNSRSPGVYFVSSFSGIDETVIKSRGLRDFKRRVSMIPGSFKKTSLCLRVDFGANTRCLNDTLLVRLHSIMNDATAHQLGFILYCTQQSAHDSH
jgi:hypothetical protein